MAVNPTPIYGDVSTGWKLTNVSALVAEGRAELQTGPFGTMLHASAYQPTGTPVIAVQHIGDNRVKHEELPRVNEDTVARLSRYQLQRGDILFGRKGAVDRRALVTNSEEGWLQGSDCIRLRLTDPEIVPQFVSYVLGTRAYRNWIVQHAHGATMPSLNQEIIGLIPLVLPTSSEQHAIADVLGMLDDKIELNRRMNETLEAIARAIFKSWFVDFDPVRAKAEGSQPVGMSADIAAFFSSSFEESEIGTVPFGWQVVSLQEVCQRITDGSHSSPTSVSKGRFMASVKDMDEWRFNLSTCRRISEDDYAELVRGDCRPLKGDVLIAKDGSYLKHIFVAERDLDVVILSSIAILRPNNRINPHVLALTLKTCSTMARMESYVSGAVLPRIVLKDFRQFKILLPPEPLQEYFGDLASPLFQKCWRNLDEIDTLSALRDTLLPRLLSGEIRIKEAVKMAGAAL